ncbi:MAG: hypothetical protein HYX92_16420 [Chloroflexi bacterium]|nr:hypothetical protein [Chloroflexota bacterium]
MSLSRVLYRLRQFINLALPLSSPAKPVPVEEILSPAQKQLFYGMARFGQRHCLKVCHALMTAGYKDVDVLRAALLHDAGKQGVGLTHRVASVLLPALAPGLLERWATEKPGAWGYGLFINLHHAERGAALARAAGASPATVELIRLHKSREAQDPRLLAFQRADEVN